MDKDVEQILYQVAMDVVMDYQSELTALNINSNRTVDFEVDIKDGTYNISLVLQDYWKYVEYGRKPGTFPNVGQIQEWIKIKSIIPRPMANGKLPTEKQLAFMIGRSIKEEGIQPKPFIDNVLKNNDKHLTKIKEAVGNALNKEIKQMLKELNN